jgi:hypothetical protein
MVTMRPAEGVAFYFLPLVLLMALIVMILRNLVITSPALFALITGSAYLIGSVLLIGQAKAASKSKRKLLCTIGLTFVAFAVLLTAIVAAVWLSKFVK